MAERVLLIGYGNPGRLDDGLGPACAAAMAARHVPGVEVDAAYQLQVEDAATIAGHDVVVFADASVDGAGPFDFRPVHPMASIDYSSHALEPPAVLALAQSLFGAKARGFTLAIRGYEFNEFGERLSPGAQANLSAAVAFLMTTLGSGPCERWGDTRLKPKCARSRVHRAEHRLEAMGKPGDN